MNRQQLQELQAQVRLDNALSSELERIVLGQRNDWWHLFQGHHLENLIQVFFGRDIVAAMAEAFLQKPTQAITWMKAHGATSNRDGSVNFMGVKVEQGRVGLKVTEGGYEFTDEESACLTTPHRIAYRKVGTRQWLPL